MKAADKIAAYLKCVEELKYGNKEFLKAKNATLKAIRDMGLPEVDYFFDNFVKGYEKTLSPSFADGFFLFVGKKNLSFIFPNITLLLLNTAFRRVKI